MPHAVHAKSKTETASDGATLFDTVAIVGVGLIGGSLALAAKQRGVVRRIIGVGRNPARLSAAQAAGMLDEIHTDLKQAAAQADLVVLATPVDLIVAAALDATSVCRSNAILTDVGSTKARICRELEKTLPRGATFLGSHPLAGSEKHGWEHARGDLLEGRTCVITPTDVTPAAACQTLSAFWQRLGMRVLEMSPEDHDTAVAQSSHLPHVVASALARTLSPENRALAATGFADTTRIAASDPDVWIPILLDNSDAVLSSLSLFGSELTAFQHALSQRDAVAMRELWLRGKATRDAIHVRRKDTDSM